MPTPHIESNKLDISSTVIMPGDPRRTQYIALNYLKDAILINEVRGELAYTGFYKNHKITIFSSGMGIPSMGIYSHELFTEYNVENIIRIGSAGSYSENLNINDLFLVTSSYSESRYGLNYNNYTSEIIESNPYLNELIKETSKNLKINLKEGRCHSSESFYTKNFDINKIKEIQKCECVEMETYSLFINAKETGKKATCLLTISDSFITGESLTSLEREQNFNKMITLALETAIKLNQD